MHEPFPLAIIYRIKLFSLETSNEAISLGHIVLDRPHLKLLT